MKKISAPIYTLPPSNLYLVGKKTNKEEKDKIYLYVEIITDVTIISSKGLFFLSI
jgi:hypothetical protein